MPLILTEPPSKLRKWRLQRTFFSFKIPIHEFHEQNNSFHLNSICCKHRHRCYNYIGVAQQQKPKFSLPWEIFTELCNSPPKNIPFFQNADSRFLMNKIICSILTLFPSCKHRHQYDIGIIQIFEHRFFNFLKACVTSRCCVHETWSLRLRMISRMTNHYQQAVHLSFVAFYKQKKSTILSQF